MKAESYHPDSAQHFAKCGESCTVFLAGTFGSVINGKRHFYNTGGRGKNVCNTVYSTQKNLTEV